MTISAARTVSVVGTVPATSWPEKMKVVVAL
jgi:hypothetical protein